MERELSLLGVGLKKNQQESVDSLLEYFRNNAGRLDYCGRLAAGRVIGRENEPDGTDMSNWQKIV